MISILRNFSGYREYPKYAVMERFQAYRNALMKEAVKIVQKGIKRNTKICKNCCDRENAVSQLGSFVFV